MIDLLTSDTDLYLTDSVRAIIALEGGLYLMQLRDDKPDIFYPGYWGLFGGSIDQGEDPLASLRRELLEELQWEPDDVTPFATFQVDLPHLGERKYIQMFFEASLASEKLSRLVLGEGREMRAFNPAALLRDERVVPFDAFAVWLHASRQRIRQS